MTGRIEGKVALVTGAASGIGAACVRRFLDEGAQVAGIDVAVPDAHPCDAFVAVDVRDADAVNTAVAGIVSQLERVDVLVNAAGVSSFGTADTIDEAEWSRVVDINLKGSFFVAKHVLAQMMKQRSGSIIHLASVEGLEGMSNSLPYNASKGGVVLMTKSMAIDYGSQGIRVNCLCPGLIETPLTAMLKAPELKFIQDQMKSWHVLDRLGKPEEVAACALFLASDDASFVTGHALVVDGGWTAGRRVTGALQGLEASAANWVVKE